MTFSLLWSYLLRFDVECLQFKPNMPSCNAQAKILWTKLTKVYKKFAPDLLEMEFLCYFLDWCVVLHARTSGKSVDVLWLSPQTQLGEAQAVLRPGDGHRGWRDWEIRPHEAAPGRGGADGGPSTRAGPLPPFPPCVLRMPAI